MELIGVSRNARRRICLTPSVAASEGKKADEGTTMSPPKSNMATVVDPAETQTLTPSQAMAQPTRDILIKGRSSFDGNVKN
jgi:hypothetical protein